MDTWLDDIADYIQCKFDNPIAVRSMTISGNFNLVALKVSSALERVENYEFNSAAQIVEAGILPKMERLLDSVSQGSYPNAHKTATKAFERVRAATDEFLANAPAEPAPASSAPQAAVATASM
ncbi:MAG: hypothetical protein AAF204_03055 [Pseudomonadota bacterium]